jgi:hypothetical protein
MTHLDKLQALIDTLEAAKVDADKFDRGNSTAGTRLRQAALDVKKGLDDLRHSVQETKRTRQEG